MIMNKTRAAMILVLLAFVAAAATNGEEKIRADRTPLTFRDSGVYCNYHFGHALAEEGLTNMRPTSTHGIKETSRVTPKATIWVSNLSGSFSVASRPECRRSKRSSAKSTRSKLPFDITIEASRSHSAAGCGQT